MACSNPIPALDFGLDPSTGKHKIKIKYPHVDEDLDSFRKRFANPLSGEMPEVVLLPCGHCFSCILAKRREWMVRCGLEALCHEENCFVTLTYDDKHLPSHASKEDAQDFIKAVRNAGYKVRYFLCCERGSNTNRLHFHAVLFGYMPKDLHEIFKSKTGFPCYSSEEVSSFWNKGEVIVQQFDAKVGSYVAGYTSKKLGSSDGFILMSKRPGLGYQFLEDNKLDIAEYWKVYADLGNMKSASVPRYFEKLFPSLNLLFDDKKKVIKEMAKLNASIKRQDNGYLHEEDVFKAREFFDHIKYRKLVRGL